jgi:hypothetical protein
MSVEMSNEAFANAKSWELPFYRKARRKASKKSPLISLAVTRWFGFSEKCHSGFGPMAD